MEDCIFCKIVNNKIPAKLLFESENVIAFDDINPSAEKHIIIIPKAHVAGIHDAKDNGQLLAEIYQASEKLVDDNNLRDGLYRVLVNGGKAQHVPHLHFHLLGGKWHKKADYLE